MWMSPCMLSRGLAYGNLNNNLVKQSERNTDRLRFMNDCESNGYKLKIMERIYCQSVISLRDSDNIWPALTTKAKCPCHVII